MFSLASFKSIRTYAKSQLSKTENTEVHVTGDEVIHFFLDFKNILFIMDICILKEKRKISSGAKLAGICKIVKYVSMLYPFRRFMICSVGFFFSIW